MKRITLWTGAGASFTEEYAEGRVESNRIRLVADDGKALKNGEDIAECIDVLATDVPNWTEIDKPPYEPELTDSETVEILMGGINE